MKEPRRQLVECKTKTAKVRIVINDALHILVRLGVPIERISQRNRELMGMCFLAVADVKSSDEWSAVKTYDGTRALRTREIIRYINAHFGENISSGSYDDIRRKHLALPVAAGIILRSAKNPNAARNNPTRAYALDPAHAEVIRQFGGTRWESIAEEFMASRKTLASQLDAARTLEVIPVVLPGGKELQFSPGGHNELQKAIIKEFLPRYGNDAKVLYVGDTADKYLHLEADQLKQLGFFEIGHGELPDIIAYSARKNWLYLIEAVHSSGPISPLRLLQYRKLTRDCTAEVVFVTAFSGRATFRKELPNIAWETEVWIADAPEHLVHFNGQRFLGPYPHAK